MTRSAKNPRARAASVLAAMSLALGAVGCATTAFSPSFPDNRPSAVKSAMSAVKADPLKPSNATGKPMAFIVSMGKPASIVAYDLSASKVAWKAKGVVSSRIVVGRQRVYHLAGKTLVGRSVSSGQIAWRAALPAGERLLGVTADGDNVYYVTEAISRSGGRSAGHLVAINGASGGKRWSIASSGRIGAPSARDGLVFVPLRSQSIAIVDGATGAEKARVRSSQEALLWTRAAAGTQLFGGKSGVYRLDTKATGGTREKASFIAAPLPKTVRPVYWWNGYNAALAGYTAYDRNRLLWRLADGGKSVRFADDRIYVHNYRFLFAFDTTAGQKKSSRLRWAYSYPRYDAVASTFTGKSILLVTAHGHVVTLDATKGLPTAEKDLKLKVRGATFDAAGYQGGAASSGKVDLRKTLKEVIFDPDRRFGAVKLFAVEQLAQLSGGLVTDDLVRIVTRSGIDKAVYKRAGAMIVARHDKSAIKLYLGVLKRHFDFVEGSHAQAVDVMARALGDLKAPEAVQPLLRHLADHETSLSALLEIVRALIAIGDKAVVDPFRDFLLTYRCDPIFAKKHTQVLNLVSEALLKMGGSEMRQMLSFIENDVHTVSPLRVYIGKALRQVRRGPAKPAKKKPAPKTKPQKKKTT